MVWLLLVNGKISFIEVKTNFTIQDHQNPALAISGSVEFRASFQLALDGKIFSQSMNSNFTIKLEHVIFLL